MTEPLVTISLVVERGGSGEPFLEEVRAIRLDTNRYQLAQSPGLVPGVAAADEIELAPEEPNGYRVIRRGGNVCVQLFTRHDPDECLEWLEPQVLRLSGRVDGRAPKLLVFTIPVASGFDAIQSIFDGAVGRFPESEWMYGNVYSTADGRTPLDWWK